MMKTKQEHQLETLDDIDRFAGRRVRLRFFGWRYGDHSEDDSVEIGKLGRDGEMLTIDGRAVAIFPNSRRSGFSCTPWEKIALLD